MFTSFSSDQTIVITNGSQGCLVREKGYEEIAKYEALHVENVKDTTGAGDFFVAGFMHGVFMKKNISQCVSLGNLTSSFVIQQIGADLPQEKWLER